MRQVAVKNFNVVSYNKFDSCEDTDHQDEEDLADQSFRIISSGEDTDEGKLNTQQKSVQDFMEINMNIL